MADAKQPNPPAKPDDERVGDDDLWWVWWMHEETAWCPLCWQGYAWELHVACVGCDRPMCPLCVDHEHADGPRCPECAAEGRPQQEASA